MAIFWKNLTSILALTLTDKLDLRSKEKVLPQGKVLKHESSITIHSKVMAISMIYEKYVTLIFDLDRMPWSWYHRKVLPHEIYMWNMIALSLTFKSNDQCKRFLVKNVTLIFDLDLDRISWLWYQMKGLTSKYQMKGLSLTIQNLWKMLKEKGQKLYAPDLLMRGHKKFWLVRTQAGDWQRNIREEHYKTEWHS